MEKRKGRLRGPFTALYEEAGLPRDVRRSLNFILFGNLCGMMYSIICGSGTTATVGLMTTMGANDLHFGIVSAIVQAAALMQIPFSILVNQTHKRKRYMLTIGLTARAVWILAGLIPVFVPMDPAFLQLWSLIFLIGVSSLGAAMIQVCWFPWFSDLAPLRIRGRWLSVKDMISAAAHVVFGIIVAQLLDTLPPESKYVIIFIIGGVIGVTDMICFGFCKEVYAAPPKHPRIRELASEIFRNKPFVHFLVMWTLWTFTGNLAAVYFVPYTMNTMGLNALQIMLFSSVASAAGTIFAIQRWGKALYRHGCRSVLLVACSASVVMPLFFLFQTPGSIWPLFLYNFIGSLFFCGANLAASSMQLSLSPDDTRPTYVATFACITSLVGGTLSSLISGVALEFMDTHHLFEGFFDRYKVLFVVAVVLRLAVVIYFVPRVENDNNGTVKGLLKSMIPRFLRR